MTSLAPATPAKQGAARSARQRILALAPIVPPSELHRRREAGEPHLPYNFRKKLWQLWVNLAVCRDAIVRLTELFTEADFDRGLQQQYHDGISQHARGLDDVLAACRERFPQLSGARAAALLELQAAATTVRGAIDG